MPGYNLSTSSPSLPYPPPRQSSLQYDSSTTPNRLNITTTASNPPQLPPLAYHHYQNTYKRVRPQNDENFASRPLCGKQASYRPVSTTVGDHVGIPVAELFFFLHFFISFFLYLFCLFCFYLFLLSRVLLISGTTIPWAGICKCCTGRY